MRAILSVFVLVLAAFPFGVPSVSAYSLGDCTYSSANGSTISSLVCPDAPAPVSVLSGSVLPNADPSTVSGTYFPAVYHVDGVWYVSLAAILTFCVWFVAVLFMAIFFYHVTVVAIKFGFNFFRRPKSQS